MKNALTIIIALLSVISYGQTEFQPVLESISESSNDVGNIQNGHLSNKASCGNGIDFSVAVTSNYNGSDISCNGSCDGQITVTVIAGGGGPYGYELNSTLQGDNVFSGLCAGSYNVTVYDSSQLIVPSVYESCTEFGVVISEPSVIGVSVQSSVNPACVGDCDGTISILTSGGIGTLSAEWVTISPFPFIGDNPSGVCAGTHGVSVTDINGCDVTTDVVITDDDIENPTASDPAPISVECLGDVPAYDVTVVTDEADNCGNVPIVTFTSDVSDGNTGPEVITRTYTITDDCGNTVDVTQTITIADTQVPFATAPSNINVQCSGDVPSPDPLLITDESDNCASSPLVSFVSDVSDGNSNPEIITRTYDVTDDEGNFISLIQTITINDITNPTANALADINIECLSQKPAAEITDVTGEADNCTAVPVVAFVADVSDGNSNPETITRTYTVTDDAGNSINVDQLIIVNDITSPTVTSCPSNQTTSIAIYNPADPIFADNCGIDNVTWLMTGATSSASPGTGMFYVGNETFGSGVTTITYWASDAAGNTVSTCIFTVTANLVNCTLAASSVSTGASCFGENDGVVDVTTTGGAAPISYQWDSGDITEDLVGVGAGTYSLTIVDNDGCDTTFSATVSEPAVMDLSINSNDPSCGESDGVAIVSVTSGGTSPFTYSWTNGSTSTQADSLDAGIYSVQVLDVNGCSASSTVIINNWNGPSISLSSSTEPSCVGDADGEIDVTITGGQGPFTYSWSEGSATEDVTGLIAGTYDLTIEDANGCETSESFTLSNPTSIDLSNAAITEASCSGADGAITVTASGGAGSYNYQWDAAAGSATVDNVSGLAAGAYALTVADANGCIASMTYSVNNIGGPVITEDLIVQPSCTGSGTGSIDVSVTGGTAPYGYSWDSGQTSEDISGITPGDYQLTVTDGGNCEAIYIGTVNGIIPLGEDICLVTVDTVTGTNLVVWTKTDTVGISHYNIYREGNSTGVYNLVGTNPVNVLSQWLDPTANPNIKSWRYKISAVDSCGNESQMSASHKTMHVTSNIGLGSVINVNWDYYDGFSYGSYYISRYTTATGWVPVDTVVSTSTSWTDPTPPNLIDIEYMIEVVPPSPCTSTKAQDHNTTRSNRHTTTEPDPQGVQNDNFDVFTLYPNPNNGVFTISKMGQQKGNWSYRVTDLTGKLIVSKEVNISQAVVNLSNCEAGIYLIEIKANGLSRIEKVVIQ